MRVFVVDTETTGLNGCLQGDRVVEVGIAMVDLTQHDVTPIFHSVVGYDTSEWTEEEKNAWIFTHSDLKLADVQSAPPFDEVLRDTRAFLRGHMVTSYNVDFDFNRFLAQAPWRVDCMITLDIMHEASKLIPGDHQHADGSSWPRLETCYAKLCPEDPAELFGYQKHRAMSDALVAGYVALALYDHGLFDVTLAGAVPSLWLAKEARE